MTFSLLALDPITGAIGGAVLTRNLAVGGFGPGTGVLWLRPGVGGVLTQSFTDPTFGPRGLRLMAAGVAGPEALRDLVGEGDASLRQVAFLDAQGRSAVHTGSACVPYAGSVVTDGAVFAANMMRDPGVPEALAASWASTAGQPFALRLLDALAAGEVAGGDVRGRQSAAIRIAPAEPAYEGYFSTDVRVDDAEDPLTELRRLENLQYAYAQADHADVLAAAGDLAGAARTWRTVRELIPESADAAFWSAVQAAQTGDEETARTGFAEAFASAPGFRELLPRLIEAGLAPASALDLA